MTQKTSVRHITAPRRADVQHLRRIGFASAFVLALALAFSASAVAASWTPPRQLTWYWQLTGTPKIEPVMATDIDGFDNGADEVAKLHAAGQHAICYIDVGTAENWRPDYSAFPASVMGDTNGWPGERWLNVADLSTLEPIMTARFQMCRAAGYDAVEPDNMDGFENSTGFTITATQQATYDEWVANEVHSLGMAVFQKNDPDQAGTLQPYFDGVIDEQCNEYTECDAFATYLTVGKPVLDAEYSGATSSFCAADNAAGIMGALYSVNLDGSVYQPCWPPGTGSSSSAGSTPPPAPPNAGAAPTASPTGSGTATSGSGSSTSGKKSAKPHRRKHRAKPRKARRSHPRARNAKHRFTWRPLRLIVGHRRG